MTDDKWLGFRACLLATLALVLAVAHNAAARTAGNLERLRASGYRACPGCDLRDADLAGTDLAGADLAYANLFGANLEGADLTGADLTRADLGSVRLKGARLVEADLSDANLDRADLESVIAERVKLAGGSLFRTRLVGARLTAGSLVGANLFAADAEGADLTRADLRGASLAEARLRRAVLLGTDLTAITLTGADLSGATFAPMALSTSAELQGLRGLATLFLPDSADGAGAARLRELLAAADLREEEADLAFAIGRNKTCSLLYREPRPVQGSSVCQGTLRWGEPWRVAAGLWRVAAGEWLTGYGRHAERVLWAGLAAGVSFAVTLAAGRRRHARKPLPTPPNAIHGWQVAAGLQLLLSAGLVAWWLASRYGWAS